MFSFTKSLLSRIIRGILQGKTYASTPSLENLTITGNSAEYGGGISCTLGSSSSLVNIIISGNSASNGGGIYCFNNSSPGLQNVTISGNSASSGGGIYCSFASNPVFVNSILWNNSPQEIYIESGSVTATYSDIEGSWAGTGSRFYSGHNKHISSFNNS
jgi:predicted outer membrane repeat protein